MEDEVVAVAVAVAVVVARRTEVVVVDVDVDAEAEAEAGVGVGVGVVESQQQQLGWRAASERATKRWPCSKDKRLVSPLPRAASGWTVVRPQRKVW